MSIFFFFNIVTNLYNSRKKTEIEVGVYKTKFYVANTREWQRPYIRVRYATTIEHERFCQIDQFSRDQPLFGLNGTWSKINTSKIL
jgi:hypothetical protein